MRVTQFIFSLTLIIAGFHCSASAQSPNKTSATDKSQSVSGRVTIHGNGFVNATVIVWPWPSTEPILGSTLKAQTDQDGNYKILTLKPGNYYISVRVQGFVAIENGSSAQPKQISLASGQALNGIDFEVVRGGVVTGRVISEGAPVVEEPVTLIRIQSPSVTSASASASSGNLTARTDDRGIYRIFGIPPGRYKAVAG